MSANILEANSSVTPKDNILDVSSNDVFGGLLIGRKVSRSNSLGSITSLSLGSSSGDESAKTALNPFLLRTTLARRLSVASLSSPTIPKTEKATNQGTLCGGAASTIEDIFNWCGVSSQHLPRHLSLGNMKNEYQVVKRIAEEGNCSKVFEAIANEGDCKRVAIKVVSFFEKGNFDPSKVSDFLREVRIHELAKGVRHLSQCLRSFYSYTEAEGYLVFEFVDGFSLQKLYNMRERDPSTKLIDLALIHRVALHILEMLVEFEEKGLHHNDIKLANVMINLSQSKEVEVTVVDLGYGRRRTDYYNPDNPVKVCGTPYYLTPQAFRTNHSVIHHCKRGDVYALGCLIHKLLFHFYPGETLEQPFHSMEALMKGRLLYTPPCLQEEMPPAEQLCYLCLEPEVGLRLSAKNLHKIFHEKLMNYQPFTLKPQLSGG